VRHAPRSKDWRCQRSAAGWSMHPRRRNVPAGARLPLARAVGSGGTAWMARAQRRLRGIDFVPMNVADDMVSSRRRRPAIEPPPGWMAAIGNGGVLAVTANGRRPRTAASGCAEAYRARHRDERLLRHRDLETGGSGQRHPGPRRVDGRSDGIRPGNPRIELAARSSANRSTRNPKPETRAAGQGISSLIMETE